jgi:pimeloyl-ACP methyl ester carboxylesterase
MEVHRSDGSVIEVTVVGEPAAAPVLLCHGLADSGVSAHWFTEAARKLDMCVVAPDRPGMGGTDIRPLARVVDWAQEAALVLDTLRIESASVLGISGGGPFAAACAAAIPGRVRGVVLVSPLGPPEWPVSAMARGERVALGIAARAPSFGGWFLGRLAGLARRSPRMFLRLAATGMPPADRNAIEQSDLRDSFLTSYLEAFRRGSSGVAQELRILTRPWGFRLGSIQVPAVVHYGDADTTVPPHHAQRYAEAIPGGRLRLHPGHGHFSILDAATEILATAR